MNYRYDSKFEGNILVVGRAGSEKTTFAQNLWRNNMFGETKDVVGLSKNPLSPEREDNIKSCFIDEQVDFIQIL